MTDEEFLAWIDAAAGRFDARPDEIVGVPMVVALDTGAEPEPGQEPGDDPLGRDFARAVTLLRRDGRAVDSYAVARIMEALAEREVAG